MVTQSRNGASRQVEDVTDAAVVLLFCSSEHEYYALLQGVESVVGEAPIVGATTSGEIVGTESFTESALVIVIGGPDVRVGVGVEDFENGGHEAAASAAESALLDLGSDSIPTKRLRREASRWQTVDDVIGTMFADHGAYTPSLMNGLQAVVGDMSVSGGWANDDWKNDGSARIFAEGAPRDDAAVFTALDLGVRTGVGVRHGVQSSTHSFTVTAGEDAVIEELDGRRAYDVFEQLFGEKIESPQFLFTKPLAVETGGEEARMILPYMADAESGEVHFDGAPVVTEGVTVRIVDPTSEELYDGAARAIDIAMERAGNPDDIAAVLLHDCGCRWFHFSETGARERELDVIRERVGDDVPIAGWYTAGEIAHPDPISGVHKESIVPVVVSTDPL